MKFKLLMSFFVISLTIMISGIYWIITNNQRKKILLDIRELPIHSHVCPIPKDLVRKSLQGDLQARINFYGCYVNFHKLSINQKQKIARELIQYLRLKILDEDDQKKAIMQLGYLQGIEVARRFLAQLAEDSSKPTELRQIALYSLAWHLSGKTNKFETYLIQKFLQSTNDEEKKTALEAIQIGELKDFGQELLHKYYNKSNIVIQAEILRTFGWLGFSDAFEFVIKQTFNRNYQIRKAAVEALSLYATKSEKLTQSQIERLKKRLKEFLHNPYFQEDAKFGLYQLKCK